MLNQPKHFYSKTHARKAVRKTWVSLNIRLLQRHCLLSREKPLILQSSLREIIEKEKFFLTQ